MADAWRTFDVIDLVILCDFFHQRIDVFFAAVGDYCVRDAMCWNPVLHENSCHFFCIWS